MAAEWPRHSKLHVVCDHGGKPLAMLLTEGQMSDHKDARMMLEALPAASALISDKGYEVANAFLMCANA
ncbi:MAG: hypothetical protein EKK29_20155 [Hyphomicrobiales bacterium]|nr:MAG: hypothetical protein EKK29_20155 [Hyphomicrobiales bacterium]